MFLSCYQNYTLLVKFILFWETKTALLAKIGFQFLKVTLNFNIEITWDPILLLKKHYWAVWNWYQQIILLIMLQTGQFDYIEICSCWRRIDYMKNWLDFLLFSTWKDFCRYVLVLFLLSIGFANLPHLSCGSNFLDRTEVAWLIPSYFKIGTKKKKSPFVHSKCLETDLDSLW